jgi:hypothetical protein
VLFVAGVLFRHTSQHGLSDPIIDLLLYIGGGVLTALLTILGGHVATDKAAYRWTFYVGGTALAAIIVATGIRNYRSSLVAETPKQIVMDAVSTANDHTDKAVDGANRHTDSQVAMVRDDLKSSNSQISAVRDE